MLTEEEKEDLARLKASTRASLMILGLIWVIFLIDRLLPFDLNSFGIVPRTASGLQGLVAGPLLHADLVHLLSNSPPLLLTMIGLFYVYHQQSRLAFPLLYVLSGLGVWCFARGDSTHIGASGLVYALILFQFTGGVVRRDTRAIGLSLLLVFLYGGMVWGVLPPPRPEGRLAFVSWESHLSGAIVGTALALLLVRRELTPDYDDEEDGYQDPEAHEDWRDYRDY